ncbi:MAG: lipase maturation factor family protein [Gammaproteobacteria bacterium]
MGKYTLTSALFLRLLALIYFIAFFSLGLQIRGLVGADGILPYALALQRYQDLLGFDAFWIAPSLFWFFHDDFVLVSACVLGCIYAVLLFFNRYPRTSLVIMFLLYLSLAHAAQVFLNFQWDTLLLEAGFLAIFLSSPSKYIVWLYRWLIFRLRFLSGISKIVSGDPTWANLTAVVYYFEVQPLPNWVSWYAHQLPQWVLMIGSALTLFIEIVIPFMMLMPRRYRFFAAWATIGIQLLIMATSNHNWINLLTIALCLFLFDDQAISRVLPARLQSWLTGQAMATTGPGRMHVISVALLALVIVPVSILQIVEQLGGGTAKGIIGQYEKQVAAFHLVHPYHIFPTMPDTREELVISGSNDGEHWQEYKFKYKPGDLNQRPPVVIPHQPRLDWMMWFVPLHPDFMLWFENFIDALLVNSPEVIALLETSPFPDSPPRMLKVDLYEYHFTDETTRNASGQWWTRKYLGPFPPLPYVQRVE